MLEDPAENSLLHFEIDNIEDVLDDIDGNIYGPVVRFFWKYFPDLDKSQETAGEAVNEHIGQESPKPEEFLKWFLLYFSKASDRPGYRWHAAHQTLFEPVTETGVHLFLSHSHEAVSRGKCTWDGIEVIGEFCPNDSVTYQHGLLSLCALARQVFAAQPTRPFLHGFYIRCSLVEFWVFDRSGLYSSEVFDINLQFARFVNIIRSYCSMSHEQFGSSRVLQSDDIGRYVTLKDIKGIPDKILYLAEQSVALRTDLVGGGTVCYLARASNSDQWDYAVKFKWRLTRNRSEDVMLNLINSRNIRNVVSLIHHSERETIADLRAGLQFGLLRQLLKDETTSQDHDAEGVMRYTEETRNRFSNKTLTCVVTTPVGTPLRTFNTPLELTQVLRDAISAHRSLLQTARILHQDISEENILISRPNGSSEPQGLLIDYDVAIPLSDQDESLPSITGTRPFMAIGVLKGEMHTYRHDLESFLYLLLWAIISNHSKNPPASSRLREWSKGSYEEIAARKTEDMKNDEAFGEILGEFLPEYEGLKPLAGKLRELMFPSRGGGRFTGTEKDAEAVDGFYERVLGAFEDTIISLRTGG